MTSPEPHPSRWPLPLSEFVGRSAELAGLGRLVDAHRLVTILGPPGIGKTRLALEWLRAPRDPGGVVGIGLSDLTDAASSSDVVQAVAKTLQLSLVGEEEANIRHVGWALAGWNRALLVLDNFEGVIASSHHLIARWLQAAPECRFIVTSRERLKIAGESVFELGPLALEEKGEAVRLFVARASAVRAGFELGPKDAGVVAQLVRELDGNPLAIELAAARTRVLSPQEILARMAERFELLVAEERGRPRRSALLDAIEGSWKMLPAWGQAALAECSVFRDGFDVAAAGAVLELAPDAPGIVDVLEALSDKSLIVAQRTRHRPELRFRLHASIRAFAAKKLDESGKTADVTARHARYYARVGKEWAALLDTEDAPRGLGHLRAELENLTAAFRATLARAPTRDAAHDALDLAASLGAILSLDGPYAVRARVLDGALALAAKTDADPARVVAALEASVLAFMAVGRAEESRANAARARDVAESLGDRAVLGRALSILGLSHGMDGKWDLAARSLADALAAVREARDRRNEGRVLGRLAWLHWARGDLVKARALYDEAVVIHRETGDRVFGAMNSGYLAMVAHDLGDLESPRKLLEHALEEHEQLGHRRVEGELTSALATLFHERGSYEAARAMQTRALAIYRQIGHARDRCSLLVEIGNLAVDEGRLDDARAAYEEALGVARSTDNTMTLVEAEARLGVLCSLEDDVARATAHFDRADAAARPGPREADLVTLLRGHMDVAEARGALARGDAAAVRAAVAAAEARLEKVHRSDPRAVLPFRTLRMAAASLGAALEAMASARPPSEMPASAAPPANGERLVVRRVARSVRTPDGVDIELERSPSLWRLVECLVDARMSTPGRSLRIDELVAAGWPEERVRTEAGARRVYTALSTLRQRGLRAWILKREDGYLLAPVLGVAIEPET